MMTNQIQLIRDIFPTNIRAIHFFILMGSLFFILLGSGEGYRTCAYLNMLFVIESYISDYLENNIHKHDIKNVLFIVWIPIAFILLDMVSGNTNPHRLDQYSKIIIVTFVAFGWLRFLKHFSAQQLKLFLNTSIVIAYLFVLIQFCVYLFIGTTINHSWRFGTFNNPHHLALFILLIGSLIMTFTLNNNGLKRLFLIGLILMLAWMLLKTSSRPAWLAIIFGVVVLIPFLDKSIRRLVLFSVITFPVLLYMVSTPFHDRVLDLIINISTEERVYIWQNSWEMLKQNSWAEWLVGHGFNTYSTAYNVFTQLKGPQYTHPHNFLLEILYISGITGLLLASVLYFYLVRSLINIILDAHNLTKSNVGKLTLVIFMMLTFHIFLTMPFYTIYNLYVLVITYLIVHYFSSPNRYNNTELIN